MNEVNTIGLPLDTTVLIGTVLATKWSMWDQFPPLSLLVIINLKQKLTDVCVCLYLPEFATRDMSVEEPEGSQPYYVNVTVVRTGGSMGVVTLKWEARLKGNG